LTNTFRTNPGASGSEVPIQVGKNIAESFVKGFSPSALAQEARRQDPLQRDVPFGKSFTEDVGGYYKSRTPGMSQSMPARQNNLGDYKTNTPGAVGQYANPLRSEETQYNTAAKVIHDLIERTGNEKLAPSALDKSVSGKLNGKSTSIKLTPERYEKAQNDVGKEIARRIVALPSGLSDEQKAARIQDIYSNVKELERNKLKKELGLK
jgi:hypothetical protein